MGKINTVQISGISYSIEDSEATKVVNVTQAEYDALPTTAKTANILYNITDAQGADLSNYYTKTEVDNAITAATSTKQDTLISGTNIKTINNESLLGSGNIDIQGGGGVNVVQTTGTSTTDVMSQDAVTTQLNNKANKSAAVGGYQFGSTNNVDYLRYTNVNTDNIGNEIYYPRINGKGILTNNSTWAQNNYNFQLVETSAITTSISSTSTDAQIPSAKAVYDTIGNINTILESI